MTLPTFTHKQGVTLFILVLSAACALGAASPSFQEVLSPRPRVVQDKEAPEGWSRYEFTYDGGDTMSVILPNTRHAEFLQGQPGASNFISFVGLTLQLTERHVAVHSEDLHYLVSYYSGMSFPADQFNEAQKKRFCQMTFARFLILDKAFATSERRGVNKLGETRAIRVNDVEGFEQDFFSGPYSSPYHCHARAVLTGRYAYVAMVASKVELKEDQFTPFLNSFWVTKN
jgi:hypothetical protein